MDKKQQKSAGITYNRGKSSSRNTHVKVFKKYVIQNNVYQPSDGGKDTGPKHKPFSAHQYGKSDPGNIKSRLGSLLTKPTLSCSSVNLSEAERL